MCSSGGQDRSLGSGISLPQWMKGRGDARYDFDQSSFSPPSYDDHFFCIRYPAKSSTDKTGDNKAPDISQDGYRPISQVLNDNKNNIVVVDQNKAGPSTTKNIDFSKHPLPCQPFIPAAGGNESGSSLGGSANKFKFTKSQGTDDGFHGEPALCGKSIVYVANRLMSRKVMKNDEANEATEGDNKNFSTMKHNEEQIFGKGSKSLPVSPIASPISTPDTSPKSRRRVHGNRYFTPPFVIDRDKYQSGWLLASILGQSRESATGSSYKIQEVDEDESPAVDHIPSKFLNRKKSISSQNLSYLGKNDDLQRKQDNEMKKEKTAYTSVFTPQPSELREMNFLSPTSM